MPAVEVSLPLPGPGGEIEYGARRLPRGNEKKGPGVPGAFGPAENLVHAGHAATRRSRPSLLFLFPLDHDALGGQHEARYRRGVL